MSKRNLLRQLSEGVGLTELTDKLLGPEAPPADFSGMWMCTVVEGDPGKVAAAMKIPWLKRKTMGSGRGEKEHVTAKGRQALTIAMSGGSRNRVVTLSLDGAPQELPLPSGEVGEANVEWDGATIVAYYRGRSGLESRRYFRDGAKDTTEMIVEFTCGGESFRRVFTKYDASQDMF